MTRDPKNNEHFDLVEDQIKNSTDSEDSNGSPKPLSERYEANNKGGYGNPPVSGQFKKNGKGGPGRKKGETNLASALRKTFRKKIPVNTHGKIKKMTPAEILAERTVEAVLAKNPSPRMLELAHDLLDKYGPQENEQEQMDFSGFNDQELMIASALFARMISTTGADRDQNAHEDQDKSNYAGVYRLYEREDGHIGFEKLNAGDQGMTDV